MTTSMSACGKANASGSLRLSHFSSVRRSFYSTNNHSASPNGNNNTGIKHGQRSDELLAEQRELFVNVLNANATRRDAKQYLARFSPSKKPKNLDSTAARLATGNHERNTRSRGLPDRSGVNLGGLYGKSRAIAETPVFLHHEKNLQSEPEATHQPMHIALVCLKSPENIDEETLNGLAVTLAQLVKLDMRLIIVLDSNADQPDVENLTDTAFKSDVRAFRKLLYAQALRLSAAISRNSPNEGRFVPGAMEFCEGGSTFTASRDDEARVAVPELLLDPLRRGVIPIVPPLAYTETGQLSRISSTNVMTALTKELARLNRACADTDGILLDRIIILDSIGGIPSRVRGDGAHVFINLEQEFHDIEQELTDYASTCQSSDSQKNNNNNTNNIYEQHRTNLEMTQGCLLHLPSSSSALIITPQEAASSSRKSRDTGLGAGTRRHKNSLIHNLLTNKPMVSSSLPAARLPHAINPDDGRPQAAPVLASTLVKRGMPLTIIPGVDRNGVGWTPPPNGISTLDLRTDPRVDLPRLCHLINDSFRRELNVDDYLARIEGRVAGIIVAGEYEGGAILTWETPPGVDTKTHPNRLVPYLDKFAVLQSSQGSSGVADIVFQAMVRSCFPRGVCWRSRKDNPVNKWYLERSAGTWQIPDTNWTLFWTGEGVVDDQQRWRDYVEVCKAIMPSWKK